MGISYYIYNWESAFIQQIFFSDICYFNSCDKRGVGVPSNMLGYQHAATGNAYALLGLYHNVSRNFLGTQLIKPLQKGKLYHVAYKINPADSSPFFMNKFGAHFYTQKTIINPWQIGQPWGGLGLNNIYPNKAHVQSNELLNYVTKWYTIEQDFVADSNYSYLIIGNFCHTDSMITERHFVSETERLFGDKRSYYFIDDVEVYQIKQLKANRQKICAGESAILYTYKVDTLVYWKQNHQNDTISFSDSIEVSPAQTTTYYLYAQNNELIDSITIQVFIQPKQDILPSDTLLCQASSLILNAYYEGAEYKWSTGDTTPQISVSQKGKYAVKFGLEGCYKDESVYVDVCAATLFFPNAFTPNGDNNNDVFKSKGVRFANYNLKVYDKWGKLCFETNNSDEGWSGDSYTADVYLYIANYVTENGKPQSQKGTVQLLR